MSFDVWPWFLLSARVLSDRHQGLSSNVMALLHTVKEHSRPLSNIEAVFTSGLSHLVPGPLCLVPQPSCQVGALLFSAVAPMSDAKTLLSGTGIFPKSAGSLSAVLTFTSGSESLHCIEDAFPHIR